MASESRLTSWPVEPIPAPDRLFMRAHRVFFTSGQLAPGVFRDHGEGMSMDWERYSTPERTRLRAKHPEDNAVIQMVAADVRAIPPLTVEHRPVPENRAHSGVIGRKDPEVRVKLRRIAQVLIPVASM
jgi:hypothetical protein